MLTLVTDAFASDDTAVAPIFGACRTRLCYGRGPVLTADHFRRDPVDGGGVVRMKLHARGDGREALLDEADWSFVRDLGVVWTIGGHTRDRAEYDQPGYVCSGAAAVRHLRPDSKADYPVAVLARVLTGATKTENVRYRNHDPLDLRRENLIVVRRRDFLTDIGVARDSVAAVV